MRICFEYQKPISSPDGRGGQNVEWQSCGKIWGEIVADETRWLQALDRTSAQKIQIKLRDAQNSGIKPGYRLIDGDLAFVITDIGLCNKGAVQIAAMKEGEDVL